MTFLHILYIFCISQVIGLETFLRYQHYTCDGTDWLRLPGATTELTNLSKIDCVFGCKSNKGCFSVNYNENSMQCELNMIFMPRNLTYCTAETGWRVYGKYTDLKTGAVAWQSSTFEDLEANRALDGNTITTIIDESYRSCSHTDEGSSYWAMEFPDASFVGRIVIYFRSECCDERSSNLHFLVSQTRDDVINDVGILCAFYAGPPADPTAPVTILCDGVAYGKFLKIKSAIGYLTLCEVFVYFL